MEVQIVQHTLNVPKETKEVIDLMKAIAEKAKSGAKALDYADLIDELAIAFKGAELIGDEVKSEYKEDIAAYLIKEVGGVFI